MKLEAKNIKFCEFASQDSNCFEATLYVDGKRTAILSDDGHGGGMMIHPAKGFTWDDIKKIQQHLAENNPASLYNRETHEFEKVPYGTPDSMQYCLDFWMGDQLKKHLVKKDVQRLRKRVAFVKDGGVYTVGKARISQQEKEQLIQHVRKEHPEAIILSCLTEAEAIELYQQCA